MTGRGKWAGLTQSVDRSYRGSFCPPFIELRVTLYSSVATQELLRIAEQACPRDATRFPALQRALAHAVMDFIRSGALYCMN